MPRYQYGTKSGDYAITSSGAPQGGVALQVHVAPEGARVTDLLVASGPTLAEGIAATVVTSRANGRLPFWGPDGEKGTLWYRVPTAVAGVYEWYEVDPVGLGDRVDAAEQAIATLSTGPGSGTVKSVGGQLPDPADGSIDTIPWSAITGEPAIPVPGVDVAQLVGTAPNGRVPIDELPVGTGEFDVAHGRHTHQVPFTWLPGGLVGFSRWDPVTNSYGVRPTDSPAFLALWIGHVQPAYGVPGGAQPGDLCFLSPAP